MKSTVPTLLKGALQETSASQPWFLARWAPDPLDRCPRRSTVLDVQRGARDERRATRVGRVVDERKPPRPHGGFKVDSEIGVAVTVGRSYSFIGLLPDRNAGQTKKSRS
jgi:hypothetical protein